VLAHTLQLWKLGNEAAPRVTATVRLANIRALTDIATFHELLVCANAWKLETAPETTQDQPTMQRMKNSRWCAVVRVDICVAGFNVIAPNAYDRPVLLQAGRAEVSLDWHANAVCSSECVWPTASCTQFPLLLDYRRMASLDGRLCCTPASPKLQQFRLAISFLECMVAGKHGEVSRGAPSSGIQGLEVNLECSASLSTSLWHCRVYFSRAHVALVPELCAAIFNTIDSFLNPVRTQRRISRRSISAFYRMSIDGVDVDTTVRTLQNLDVPIVFKVVARVSRAVIEECCGPARLGPESLWAATQESGNVSHDTQISCGPCFELQAQLPLIITMPQHLWLLFRRIALLADNTISGEGDSEFLYTTSHFVAKLSVSPCQVHAQHVVALLACYRYSLAAATCDSSSLPCERNLMPLLDDHRAARETPSDFSRFELALPRVVMRDVDIEFSLHPWVIHLEHETMTSDSVSLVLPRIRVVRDLNFHARGTGLLWSIGGPCMTIRDDAQCTLRHVIDVGCRGVMSIDLEYEPSDGVEAVAVVRASVTCCNLCVDDLAFDKLLTVLPQSLPKELSQWLLTPLDLPSGVPRWDSSISVLIDSIELSFRKSGVIPLDTIVRFGHSRVTVECCSFSLSSILMEMSELSSSVAEVSRQDEESWFFLRGSALGAPGLAFSYTHTISCCFDTVTISIGTVRVTLSEDVCIAILAIIMPVLRLSGRIAAFFDDASSPSQTSQTVLLLQPELQLLALFTSFRVSLDAAYISLDRSLRVPISLSCEMLQGHIEVGRDSVGLSGIADQVHECAVRVDIQRLRLVDDATSARVVEDIDCKVEGSVSAAPNLLNVCTVWSVKTSPIVVFLPMTVVRKCSSVL